MNGGIGPEDGNRSYAERTQEGRHDEDAQNSKALEEGHVHEGREDRNRDDGQAEGRNEANGVQKSEAVEKLDAVVDWLFVRSLFAD